MRYLDDAGRRGLTMRLIASLALVGLLVSCQRIVAPTPTVSEVPSGTPAPPSLPPQPTSAVVGSVAGAWNKIADVPAARSGAAVTTFDGRIVVIGGVEAPRRVDRYDAITKMWDRLPDLPFGSGVDNGMAAGIDEGIDAGLFLFGGFTNNQPSKKVWYLPRDTDQWHEINSMPDVRVAGAAVTIGKKVYIVGGAVPQARGTGLATFQYDLEGSPTWSTKAGIPTGRDHLAATAVGGRVCAFGGRELSIARTLSVVECYDPATDKWEQLPPMPTIRGALGAAAVGDRVVVAGGEDVGGVIRRVDVLDVKARTWSQGPDLAVARQGLGVVALGKTVYAIGGGDAQIANAPSKTCEAWTLP